MNRPCYMCGAPSTHTDPPDLPEKGIALCDDTSCETTLEKYMLQPDLEENKAMMYALMQDRARRHRACGNRPPAYR